MRLEREWPVRPSVTPRCVAVVFVSSAVAWLAWLIVAPILPVPLAAITYALGSFICHQRPERSFHLGVAQLPVCARCIGIYTGVALAGLVYAGRTFIRPEAREGSPYDDGTDGGRRTLIARWPLVLSTMPTVMSVVVEWAGVWQPSNIVRAGAGVPLGVGLSLVVIGALTTLHYDECAPRRPIVPPPRQTPI